VEYVKVEDLTKSHGQRALWQISFGAAAGQLVAVEGPSGAGKTSLLSVLGLLSKPTAGTYVLGGDRVDDASATRRQELRASTVTSIFQQGNLFPHLTVLENVLIGGGSVDQAKEELARVGLEKLSGQLAGLLSGGEQQRTAIARALARDSRLVLADEPVASLDRRNADAVMGLLHECAARGAVVVIASHDPDLAANASQVVRLGAEVSA
jgi:putative ABC transport system ATP-binding protein